jgi:biofilm PGA synthesis N-glycosyltransferase PgaC
VHQTRHASSYVLVTPVKNEAKLIGITIESVVRQTVRPAEWVIVSDGSTDRTDEIVRAAARDQSWIRLLALPPRPDRNFAAVVRATEAGLLALSTRDYEYVGLLDSDVRFQSDYFAQVMAAFASRPQLGLAGGVVIDVGLSKELLPFNRQDVPGAVQFFRRSCFDALGGLIAIPEGGWDALTCARARMIGYETRLLTHLVVDHLKPRNIAEGSVLRRKWQLGVRDFALGYHPLFEAVKCLGRMREPPFAIGGLAWWLGFCAATVQRRNRQIPAGLLAFVRKEQMGRIRALLRRQGVTP